MKRIVLLFLSFLLLAGIHAQSNNENASSRPKVGVVLGGGGARGASHIGVLKYIEELGIPVDYVAGTSMGSIIGGLYAMGYDPDEMTQLISNIPWDEYIGNKIERTTMSAETRQRNSTTMLDIPFSLQSLKNPGQNTSVLGSLPGAYVNNSGLINLFNDLCVGYQEEMDFNDMPIPFACVATDLITGDEVIMREGVVPQAMRASMAIPGVFSPVVIGDHVMVDGGLVNNFPADVLREMGADIVIGVEVTSEKTWTPEMLRSLPQVMARLITNITNAKRTTNRGLCDVHLTPDIAGFGMLSFTPDAIETLVDRGYRVAQENRDALMAIKQAVDKAAGHPVGKELHAPRSLNLMEFPITLNDVHIQGIDPKYDRWMIRKSGLKPGGKYSKEDIERAISIYRGTGCFDEITYNLIEAGSGYDLNINITPATPNVVGLAARYDTEEGAALLFSAGLNEKAFDGHKFSLKAKLSYNPRISAQYTYSRHSLANFNLFYDLRNEHYKDRYNYVDFINFHHYQQRIGASVSQFHLLNLSACAGAYLVSTTYDKLGISGDDFEAYLANNKEFVPFVEIQYDNLDDAYFAKHGLYGKLRGELTYDIDTSLYNSKNVSLAFQSYLTPMDGKVTIIPQAYGRYFFGDPQYYNLTNFFGGEIAGRHYEQQLPFIGITYAQDGAPVMGILRCDVRYNFYGKHYLTAMYNVLVEKYSTFNYYTHGAGLKYSFNSPLGPISLTGQWETLTHKFNAYFSFGYTF